MQIKPTNNYVLIERLPITRNVTWVSSDYRTNVQRWCKVVDVGPGALQFAAEVRKTPVEVGDYVYVALHGIYNVPDSDLAIASEYDILFKTSKNPEEMEPEDFQPIGNLILVKRDLRDPEVIQSSNEADNAISTGVVTAVGTGWINMHGEKVPFQVNVGDKVHFIPTQTLKIDGYAIEREFDHILISHSDIIGVYK